MKVACNFDNTNSILSSLVQENVAPLGLRSFGVVKAEGFDNTNSIKSQAVQQNVVPCGLRSFGVVNK